jgi:hypothetical protein
MAKIQREFAIFLLYSGCEGSPPKVQFQLEIGLNGHAKRSRISSCAVASKKSEACILDLGRGEVATSFSIIQEAVLPFSIRRTAN